MNRIERVTYKLMKLNKVQAPRLTGRDTSANSQTSSMKTSKGNTLVVTLTYSSEDGESLDWAVFLPESKHYETPLLGGYIFDESKDVDLLSTILDQL